MKRLLRGSNWIGQPADYSHCVALAFRTEQEAHVTLGFGQTLYFVAACRYELLATTALRLTYDSAPKFVHPAFAFTPGVVCTIPVTLEAGEFSGTENIVNWPFTYFWRLHCGRPPFPEGVPFPRPLPTEFYGYKQGIPDAALAEPDTEGTGTVEERDSMPLAEARQIVAGPAPSPAAMLFASRTICESADSTLEDLLACASLRFRSAAWRPALLLHDRTGIARRLDDNGFIVIDIEFWRDYITRLRRAG